MSATILDGKELAKVVEQDVVSRLAKMSRADGANVPLLATILVGNDPASETYVKMKVNACKRIGIGSRKIDLPEDTSTDELLEEIGKLNDDPQVSGILLQHPVPSHIDERVCFDAILREKDVDGVTCHGFGRMAMGQSAFGSATPAGIIMLLKHYKIPLAGKLAVVVGRSPILGKPLAMMLLNLDMTVVICHSKTRNLRDEIARADVLVGAVGKPELIKSDWIKKGAVVIDAGYHPGGVGDIEKSGLPQIASAYTPVPGGVGPMTIAALIAQTVDAAQNSPKHPLLI